MNNKFLVATIFLIGLFVMNMSSFATVEGPYTYEINGDGDAIITAYNRYVDPSYPNITMPDAFPIGVTTGAATVVGIGEDALDAKHLDSVVLPSNLKYIDKGGLRRNNFTSIVIPDTVENIGRSAFWNCDIISVDLPDSLRVIGYSAFSDNEISAITLPSQLEELGAYSFEGNKLTSVVIPDGITEISDYAFADNQLTSLVLPSDLVKIGCAAFQKNQLTEVTIPNKVTYIGQWSFRKNQLHTLNLEGPVEDILYEAFMDNVITSLDLSKGAVRIYASSFENNAITNLILSDDISSIGDKAFYNNKIGSVELPPNRLTIGNDAFSLNDLSEIPLPVDKKLGYRLECEVYRSDWSNFLYYLNADYITDFTKLNYLEWDPRILEGRITISNNNQYGEVLSVDVTNVSNDTYTKPYKPTGTIVEVPNEGNFTYQWYRDTNQILGATLSNYQITKEDIGHKIRCRVGSDVEFGLLMSDYGEIVTKAYYPRELLVLPTVATYSYNSIGVRPVVGYEYLLVKNNEDISIGTWQDSPNFGGLYSLTAYDLYQRFKESDVYFQSDVRKMKVSTSSKKSKSSDKKDNGSSPSRQTTAIKEVKLNLVAQVEINEQGKLVTKATVADDSVAKKIKLIEDKGQLIIELNDTTSDFEAIFSLNAIAQMEKKKVAITIKNDIGSYTLPLEGIKDRITKAFASDIEQSSVKLKLRIAKGEQLLVKRAESNALNEGARILTTPVAFELEATYNGKTIEIEEMGRFVTRTISIPDSLDVSKIATGVAIENDGTMRPIPTRIIEKDGIKYAVLSSVTNSFYTIVEHQVECDKISGHWAEEEILEAINGLIIPEALIDVYNPDDEINRADFTKILSKTLGLKKAESNQFDDIEKIVNKGYIYAAYNYGLVSGRTTNTFGPSEMLTREQAVTILYNVLKLTEEEIRFDNEKMMGFDDVNHIALYAMEPMEWAVSHKLISGKSATRLAPKENMTCAEAIVMVNRLLKILKIK